MLTFGSIESRKLRESNEILRKMFHYFRDAEKDSDDIYAVIFPEIVCKTTRRKYLRAVNELESWINDDNYHVIASFQQYVLYSIIEFYLDEEDAYNEAVVELGIQAGEFGLFRNKKHHQQERGEANEPFGLCFPNFDPMEFSIVLLQSVFDANLRLNKTVIDKASRAVVPAKVELCEPAEIFEVENDYVWFCFTKFTKTSITIQKIIKMSLYEDALILTRSNYETLIHAKSVIVSPRVIDHLVEFKLGLEHGTYKKVRGGKSPPGYRIIADSLDPEVRFSYTNNIREIAKLAGELYSYDKIYKYLCDLTHCDINTIGYYQEDDHYTYKGASRETLMNSLMWNVYFSWKFYQVLLDGNILDADILYSRMKGAFIEQSWVLKKVFDWEILKSEAYINSISDEVLRGRVEAYIVDLTVLSKEVCLNGEFGEDQDGDEWMFGEGWGGII